MYRQKMAESADHLRKLTRRTFLRAAGALAAAPSQLLQHLAKTSTISDVQLLQVMTAWREDYGFFRNKDYESFVSREAAARHHSHRAAQCMEIMGKHIDRLKYLLKAGKIAPSMESDSFFGWHANILAPNVKSYPVKNPSDGLNDIRLFIDNHEEYTQIINHSNNHLLKWLDAHAHHESTDKAAEPPKERQSDGLDLQSAFSKRSGETQDVITGIMESRHRTAYLERHLDNKAAPLKRS